MAFLPQDNTQDVSGIPANDAMAQLELQRRLKMAQQLQQEQAPQGQMVSGHYVAPAFTQQLAGVFNKYIGSKAEENAMKQYGDYTKAEENKKAKAYGDYLDKLSGTKTTTMQPTTVDLQQGMNVGTSPFGTTDQVSQVAPKFGMNTPAPQNMAGTTTQMNPVTTRQPLDAAGQYRAMLELGTQIKDPTMIREAMAGNVGRLVKSEDRAADQEFQRILNKDKQGFELTQQEKQFANQMSLQKSSQQFQAGEGKLNRQSQYNLQAPVSVMGPDGKPMYVERNKAIGMQPYTAAQEAKDVAKVRGGENFETMISGLRNSYKDLGEMGGITSTKQSGLSNLGAGIASSGVGQATGRLFGTKEQSIRNNIAQSRPLLLNAIKEATGMSSKQMDSNAELNLYLRAATDPTLDLETNLKALDQIEKLYGGNKSSNQPKDNQQMSDDDLISKYTK